MKRFALCGLLVLSFSVLYGFEPSRTQVRVMKRMQKKSLIRELGSSYLASLIVSGFIGATTGSLSRYLEKQLAFKFDMDKSPLALFIILFGWLLESEFRNDMIAGLQKDYLDTHQIDHKKGLMFKAAWLASWLAYLQS